jgi:hypothetical protein
MSRSSKLLRKVLDGYSDANVPFHGLCQMLLDLGFSERISGSHHIFSKCGVVEILNCNPRAHIQNLTR